MTPRRVLFVDDETEIVAAFVLSLEILGWQGEGFTSPISALKSLAANPGGYDCVITDFTFPEMSCADFVAKARLLRPEIPIHLCTGNAVHEIQEAAAKLGITHVLYKPFDFGSLEKFLADISGTGT